MFTDLVASTERAREFGDRRWRRVLDEHERVSAEQIERFRGRLVKNTGDGVLATFGAASDAIDCVLAIERSVHGLGLEIHSGIHVGDVERRGDDIGGTTVNIAARVMAAAAGGEVLLTTAAYEAAAGSGIRFAAAGEHSFKGFSETRLLYRVERCPRSPRSPARLKAASSARTCSTEERRAVGRGSDRAVDHRLDPCPSFGVRD